MEVHHEYADQAAAYALGALTPAERADFEAHLANCARCAAEVRSFAPVVGDLGITNPAAVPSPAVRERLLSAIRSGSGSVTPLADARAGVDFKKYSDYHTVDV